MSKEMNFLDYGRVPPQATEIESAVLSTILASSNALIEILPILKPDIFYAEKHSLICKAILTLVEKDAPVDLITIVDELKKHGSLENVGGAYYIASMGQNVTLYTNIHYHYRLLMEKYFRREIIRMASETIAMAYDETKDVFDTFTFLTTSLDEIEIYIGLGSYIDSKQVYKSLLDSLATIDKPVSFVQIGDKGIDEILLLSPGNLINISGKSGAGKTSFVAYLAKAALDSHKDTAILWYTMEDEATKILCNFISPNLGLTHSQIHEKNYKLTIQEKADITKYSKVFALYDIEFSESPAYMSHIKTHFQRFCAKRPNKFNILIIDNVMLLKENVANRFKGKTTDVDDHIAGLIHNTFTSTKTDYNVNVWYLHHLTKEQLSKTNFQQGYRPTEDNIRGSARLRDMCTQGILINRPGDFPDILKHYKGTTYEEMIEHLMVCEVFKNRNGKTGFFRYFVNLDYKIFYPF